MLLKTYIAQLTLQYIVLMWHLLKIKTLHEQFSDSFNKYVYK